MRSDHYRIIWTLAVLPALLFAASARSGEKPQIRREVSGIGLGMTQAEVAHIFQMTESEDPMISLMRDWRFGDPNKEKQKKLRLGLRQFELSGKLPEGAAGMTAMFSKGVLYRIAVHYKAFYTELHDWDVFVSPTLQRYASPLVWSDLATAGTTVVHRWSDGKTMLEIAKFGALYENKTKFKASAYNVFYSDVQTEMRLKRAEQNEDSKLRGVPEF